MGIFGKLVGKGKAMEGEKVKALEKILEKMGIPKDEIVDFEIRVGPKYEEHKSVKRAMEASEKVRRLRMEGRLEDVVKLKPKNFSEDFIRIAELADELVSRERSRAAGAKKVEISPWGVGQISEMINMLMPMLRIAGPALPVTTKLMKKILISGGKDARSLFHIYIEKAVEDVIKENLKKATKEDIRKWQSKKW